MYTILSYFHIYLMTETIFFSQNSRLRGYSYIYFSVTSQNRFNLYRKIYNKMFFLLDRNDGYYYNAIELPTYDLFYLLRFDSPCQRVKGMHVREEFVLMTTTVQITMISQDPIHREQTWRNVSCCTLTIGDDDNCKSNKQCFY